MALPRRVEAVSHQALSLKYEPASEPLNISLPDSGLRRLPPFTVIPWSEKSPMSMQGTEIDLIPQSWVHG